MAEPIVEPTASAVEALADRLRTDRRAVYRDPAELAQEFDLPVSFVEDVVVTLRDPHAEDVSVKDVLRSAVAGCMDLARKIGGFLRKALAYPVRVSREKPLGVIALTTLVGLAFSLVVGSAESVLETSATGTNFELAGVIGLILVLLVALHLTLYAVRAQVGLALRGTLIYFGILAPVWALISVVSDIQGSEIARVGVGLVIALLLSLVYGGLAVIAALVGAFFKARREERSEERLSRQDLLERLIDVRERVRHVDAGPKMLRRRNRLTSLRTSPAIGAVAVACGAVLGAIEVLLLGGPIEIGGMAAAETTAYGVLTFFVAAVWFATVMALGFFSGGVVRSLLAVLLCFVAGLLMNLLPVGGYGIDYVRELFEPPGPIGLAALMVFATLAGQAGYVDERTNRRKRLSAEDPAALVAELVNLQWRLDLREAPACVMSVDVAGSTKMKANEDEILVEWSFREYQKVVASVVAQHGGRVLSTAGDGAIAAFPSAPEAMRSAKAVQTSLARFNAETNRLASPFRVRIGLHSGRVRSDLNEVQFNEMIDIAAHVQETAPVGGIAVTQEVARLLDTEPLAAMASEVDDQAIYFALNPTLA